MFVGCLCFLCENGVETQRFDIFDCFGECRHIGRDGFRILKNHKPA